MDQTVAQFMTIAYVSLSIVGLLIISFVVYRLVRTFLRAMSSTGAVFGDDLRTRMISFGVAALMFPRVVPEVIRVIFGLFVGVYSDIPRWLSLNYQRAMPECTSSTNDCIGRLWFGFATAWGSGLDDLYANKLSAFPVSDAIFMLTLWAVVAQLLAAPPLESSETGAPGFWVQRAYSKLSGAGRQNLRFFVVLAIAGYLSIAAIAAIPGLLETEAASAEVSVERLREQLSINPQSPDLATIEKANPFQLLEDVLRPSSKEPPSLVAATDRASEAATPARTSDSQAGTLPAADVIAARTTTELPEPPSPRPPLPQQIDSSDRQFAERRLGDFKRERQELVNALKALSQSGQDQARTARSTAATTYQASSIQRKGSREQVQHFLAVATWFQEGIAEIDRGMRTCASSIDVMDRNWSGWTVIAQRDLQIARVDRVDFRIAPSLAFNIESYQQYQRALEACRPAALAMGQIPPRPALGGNLGPFGVVASWLLRTESLPLALVVGLFGFGLLGSACSTFVRERAKQSSTEVLVHDLPGVVIRGLSAAIVVFLAVEGGLAIFASGTAQPNPYVLLFTCLVGAVFSEDVWDWAHKQLRGKLALDEASDEDPKPETPDGETGANPSST